jgi:predicted DNA-binding protein
VQKEKLKSTSIRLAPAFWKKLEDEARKQGRPPANLARFYLEQGLKKDQQKRNP